MADNTILQQGRFTSDGKAKLIQLRSDIDWMRVFNYTVSVTGGAGTGAEFFWQRGMAIDTGIEYKKLAADNSLSPALMSLGGFSLVNTFTHDKLDFLNPTLTAISAATPPVASANFNLLKAGDIVRFTNVVGAQQFGGVDFELGTVVANTSFELVYAPTIVAGTTGFFRKVLIPPAFYPRQRFISAITAANPAVVTTTVSHRYTVGQKVRLQVPAVYGMRQADRKTATVTAATASTFTTDLDASAFTAFAWPLTAAAPFTHAIVSPIGEASEGDYANLLDDATVDEGAIVMRLAAGVDSPGGVSTNLIYWSAGKAFQVDNE